jgi:hypothetical protein
MLHFRAKKHPERGDYARGDTCCFGELGWSFFKGLIFKWLKKSQLSSGQIGWSAWMKDGLPGWRMIFLDDFPVLKFSKIP